MKWIAVIVLAIVGVLAAIVAVEYFTVAIHQLPSILGPHHGRGHYRKRGAGAALIAVVAFAISGYLAFRIVRSQRMETAGNAAKGSSTAGLSSDAPAPDAPAAPAAPRDPAGE
jgi:uncharacterized membrane protein YidH (DUF202 family)